jgi:hypothetical protein
MPAQTKFRVVLAWNEVPPHLGQQGAADIAKEFSHREWHENARCDWDGSCLILQAENDYDEDGRGLRDEFFDAISASISEPFDGGITVRSISKLG